MTFLLALPINLTEVLSVNFRLTRLLADIESFADAQTENGVRSNNSRTIV
jgi:hypothetical protein